MIEKIIHKFSSLVEMQLNGISYTKLFTFCIVMAVCLFIYFILNDEKILYINIKRFISFFILLIYIYVIFNIAIFSRSNEVRQVNLLPFYNFRGYITGKNFNATELIGNVLNILFFIPLGFILSMFKFPKYRLSFILISSATVSVLIELLQFIMCKGQTVTDDIICNVIGSLIGYKFFVFANKIVRIGDKYNERR